MFLATVVGFEKLSSSHLFSASLKSLVTQKGCENHMRFYGKDVKQHPSKKQQKKWGIKDTWFTPSVLGWPRPTFAGKCRCVCIYERANIFTRHLAWGFYLIQWILWLAGTWYWNIPKIEPGHTASSYCRKVQSRLKERKKKTFLQKVPPRGRRKKLDYSDSQSKQGKDMICIWFQNDKSSRGCDIFSALAFSVYFLLYFYSGEVQLSTVYEEEMNLGGWSECVLRVLGFFVWKICAFVCFSNQFRERNILY